MLTEEERQLEFQVESLSKLKEKKLRFELLNKLRECNHPDSVQSMRDAIANGKVPLKSDFKKTNAFTKKIKMISSENQDEVCAQLKSLKLNRYLGMKLYFL